MGYTKREKRIMYNAMQFAFWEANGKPMRKAFAEIMVDDFVKEMQKINFNK